MAAWRKTIEFENDNGEACAVTLTYSALTFIIYKNFFNSDMMADVLKISRGISSKDVSGIRTKEDAENLPGDKLAELTDKLFNADNLLTFIRIAAALIASSEPTKPLTFEYIVGELLPADFAYNPVWTKAVSEFLAESTILETVKKNIEIRSKAQIPKTSAIL